MKYDDDDEEEKEEEDKKDNNKDKEEGEEEDDEYKYVWVTRPERIKGTKDQVKMPEGPPTRLQ